MGSAGAATGQNIGLTPIWELENNLIAMPGVPAIAGKRYTTIQDCLDYAKTQSPAIDNRWVVWFGGENAENLAVPSFVGIKGITIGSRLTGELTSEGNWVTDVYEYMIENCYVADLKLGASQSLMIYNCILAGGSPAAGNLAVIGGNGRGTIDLSSLTQLWTFNWTYFGVMTTLSFPADSNIYGTEISGISINLNFNGGDFNNSSFSVGTLGNGTYTLKDCTFSSAVTVSASKTVTANNCTFAAGITISGGTLTTKGCTGTVTHSSGTWNNNGDSYNNATSGLAATNEQAAIDEIALDISSISGYGEIKEPTKITDTPLDARVISWQEDRYDCCELSNGKIVVVYCLNDNKTYYQIFDTDFSVDVGETELLDQAAGTNIGDAFDIKVKPIGDDWIVVHILAANGPYYQIMTAAGGWTKNKTACTNADADCTHCDLAIYPDGNNFVIAHEGAGSDGFVETFNAAGTSQDTVEFDAVGAVSCIAVDVLSDETIIIATFISTIELYVYDGSDPTALANDYTGGTFFNTTWVAFASILLEIAVLSDDTFRVTSSDQGIGADKVRSSRFEVVGNLGSGTRTIRQIFSNRLDWTENEVNGGEEANDEDHVLIMQSLTVGEPAEMSLGFFDIDGNQVGSQGIARTVGGIDMTWARSCAVSGGRFFIICRNESDASKPYFFVYGVS